jgi:hypothetical protein
MSVPNRPRRLIGKLPTLGERELVFLCDDAVELDLINGYTVETKRVFFSDVKMISWHRQFSRWGLWIGVLSVVGALISLYYLDKSFGSDGTFNAVSGSFWIAFWIFIAPNFLILAWFMRPYAYITVFGTRTRATMRWHFRHGRSRQVYDELVRLVTAHQERDRSAQAALQARRGERELPAAALPPVAGDDATPDHGAGANPPAAAIRLPHAEPPPAEDPGIDLGG